MSKPTSTACHSLPILNLCRLISMSLVLLGFISVARGSVILEPYLGYEFGSMKFDNTGTDTSFSNHALVLGGRATYRLEPAFVGLDLSFESGSAKRTAPSELTVDMTSTNLYLLGGMDFLLLRGFVGLGLLGDTTFKNVTTVGDQVLSGFNFKVGVSYTVLPFVDFNVEYVRKSFSKLKMRGGETSINGTGDIILASVSMPFLF